MNSKVHDGGKRLQFGSRNPIPLFRHPYEKYGSRISDDSFYQNSDNAPCRGSDTPEIASRRAFKNFQDDKGNGRKGLEERNTLICQTFLTENPFFGAYYPAIRPRSAEGISNKGSERSRSLSTDFDDTKTYKIIYTGDSVCNEDLSSANKYKKSDDVRHFHEHHHFFHDKNDDTSSSNYCDKYQYGKAKEQAKNLDPNKSFLKQPIQESCMIHQMQEDRTQRLEPREPKKDKSKEGSKHVSRSSSKSGKKSSDNETYTVVCEHCQRLLKEHPNARIVGHENIPVFSGESYDRKANVQRVYNYVSVQKTNWKPANTFVAEPQYQVQRLTVSRESSKHKKRDKLNSVEKNRGSGRDFVQSRSGDRSDKKRGNIKAKISNRRPSIDSDSRSFIFKCDHCQSIIEKDSESRKGSEDRSSSSSSREFDGKIKNLRKGSLVKGSAATNRSSVGGERKSSSYKGLKGSRTLDKKNSPNRRVSGKMSGQQLYKVLEKKKISAQRTSSSVMDERGSKEAAGKRRSSSFNASRDANAIDKKQSSSYKERRASSEITKRNGSGKGSREARSSGKRINSAVRQSKDSNGARQKNASRECSVGKNKNSGKKESDKSASCKSRDKKSYEEPLISCTASGRSSTNRKELETEKVEKERARKLTEDRSMQTGSGKFTASQETTEPKRSNTASKVINRNSNKEDSRRSGTAPGGLIGTRSNNPHVKSSTVGGSATLSKRTVASKDTPVIQVESTPEAEKSSQISGIQTEITDLKTQLDRLEALHILKTEVPDDGGNGTHEAIDCPKHPIVVCTSTTYIMTKCGNDCGDRKGSGTTPKEPEKIPSKPEESCPGEEVPAPKCRKFCCSERNPSRRAVAPSAEKATKPKCCPRDAPTKAGRPRKNCQFVGARITRAINRVCRCPSRDFLSKYCEGPGRTRSCDRSDTCRRLFGNGKNQKNWLRGGLLRNYCDASERVRGHCPECYRAGVDVARSARRSYSDAACGSERLITYQSYSTVLRDYRSGGKGRESSGEIRPSRPLSRNDVEIDDTSRPGHFLRTSVSDVCEYQNGSLICLMGKSGWVVYTKKLFLQGKDSQKKDEFSTSTYSKSIVTIKKTEPKSNESQESKNVLFDRQALSDSSIYLPFVTRALNEEDLGSKGEESGISVHLPGDVRLRNRGASNLREARNDFPNELYLLDCKSAADRNATCGDVSENARRCTCRRRGRRKGSGEEIKEERDKGPVPFEKAKRDKAKDAASSGVSPFAEKSKDAEASTKVTWSTDCSGYRGRKPCAFGAWRSRRNRRKGENFSMNDKQRKYRWHRSTNQKNAENYGTYDKPEGDSPQNRCACCNCSPNHACSPACERTEGEVTGIRKLLKDIGISGLTLGFSRKTPYCRPGFVRPQNVEEGESESPDANYESFPQKEKEEAEVTEELEEEIGSSVTDLKKVDPEDGHCDCAKQLLTQGEYPQEPITRKHESWEEVWEEESRKVKIEPLFNPDVLDDISLQRRRITECENLLRQFEMQLEDVKRQNEAYACKCEENPAQEEPRPVSTVVEDSEAAEAVTESKYSVAKDDGYIRFEGKILTQVTAKKSTKSIGCGVTDEDCKRLRSGVRTLTKTCLVKNATQMTSDTSLQEKENHASEQFIKEVNLEGGELEKAEEHEHACCSLPPKIEICCERTLCTCEKCCNIHYIDKHYLPTSCFKKCPKYETKEQEATVAHLPPPKKEIFTNTSERSVTARRRDEYVPVKDEGTCTTSKPRKDEAATFSRRPRKDEATSTACGARKDEATSTACGARKDEATSICKAKREDHVSQREVAKPKEESVPVKSGWKAKRDEATSTATRSKKDACLETDRSRFRKESECISEKERFVNQSDLDKSLSEGDKGDKTSSKDLSDKSCVKSRTREVICECDKTSTSEKCEDDVNCECASKGVRCAEKRKTKRFCDCGSKLRLIEDRLRALESRKRTSESTISSPKERRPTTEESSVASVKERKMSSETSVVSEKEPKSSSESGYKTPGKQTSERSSASYEKEKRTSEEESSLSRAEEGSSRIAAEGARKDTTESSSLTEKTTSLENIESETDMEIKTKVITCNDMNFFDGGDPNVKTKCQCMEDTFCPFKHYPARQDLPPTQNILFVTNIDLLRQWSGLYGCAEYSYCKNFWNVNESALKPVKLPRDWRNVKTAVASFFRSCKLRKNFTFRRGKKSDGESFGKGAASGGNLFSESENSFVDDCSRSSAPPKRRSFHVLEKTPRPTRPVRERRKTGSDKKRRKKTRKKKIYS